MRDDDSVSITAPGFRFAHPGYKRRNKEAERRQTQCLMPRTQAARGSRHGECGLRRPPLAGALACRRSTTALAKGTYVTQGAAQARLPGTRSARALPAIACPSPGSTSRPGRNAGRLMPEPPGSGLQSRPRAPHSPQRPGMPPGHVLHERDRFAAFITETVTDVENWSLYQ